MNAGDSGAGAPPLALSVGEPAGIGPDITVMLAARGWPARVVAYADPALLDARARQLGLTVSIGEIDHPENASPPRAGHLDVIPTPLHTPVTPGQGDAANAGYVLACLDQAIDACIAGSAAAMVTAPVNKALLNRAGEPFSGHTEYIAARVGAGPPVMMLVSGALRVALATTHLPVSAVPNTLDAALLDTVATTLVTDLVQRFGLKSPRVAVCGLNPHAGEAGHLGREDIDLIAPAVAALRARGHAVCGPLPADTVFAPIQRQRYDAILAMYHDQGLAPLKALGFGEAVNVTLGLPIIRTSVDHGTAFTIAGTGRADASSLAAAVDMALDLAGRHHDG